MKSVSECFPFINFEHPLYISTKREVKFGLTSGTARNLIFLQTLIESLSGWESVASYLISQKSGFLKHSKNFYIGLTLSLLLSPPASPMLKVRKIFLIQSDIFLPKADIPHLPTICDHHGTNKWCK